MNIRISPQSLKNAELLDKVKAMDLIEREKLSDYIDTINKNEKREWHNASMPVLMKIWDNQEDSVYDSY
jgi:hypothetical protein